MLSHLILIPLLSQLTQSLPVKALISHGLLRSYQVLSGEAYKGETTSNEPTVQRIREEVTRTTRNLDSQKQPTRWEKNDRLKHPNYQPEPQLYTQTTNLNSNPALKLST